MAIKTETKAVLLISKNPSIVEATRSSLAKVNFLKLIDKEVASADLLPFIAQTKPTVILLDFEFQDKPFKLIEKIVSEYPRCLLVSILPDTEMENSDRVVLAGARAFIQFPYELDNLIVIIKRVLDLQVRKNDYLIKIPDADIKVKSRNTFTVFSPKGGVGTTTIAINMAISLLETSKEDVLLIDGKHQFGDAALYLNLHTGNSINDLLLNIDMLDQRLVDQVVLHHNSGIYVLPSPNSLLEAQGIKPENIFKLIQSLQQVFTYIIIDGGNHLGENTVTYMDSSNNILLVLNPDLASMRDVRLFMEISTTLSYPRDKTLLILNQAGRKVDVKKEEIEKILKMKVFSSIPADENLALSSLNEGIPILLKNPRHPISKAFLDCASELIKITQTIESEDLEKEKKKRMSPSKQLLNRSG